MYNELPPELMSNGEAQNKITNPNSTKEVINALNKQMKDYIQSLSPKELDQIHGILTNGGL